MKTVNFVLPFNSVNHKTLAPEGTDWVHLAPEKGSTVVVQVRGEGAVIDGMIADPANLFLEEVEVASAES